MKIKAHELLGMCAAIEAEIRTARRSQSQGDRDQAIRLIDKIYNGVVNDDGKITHEDFIKFFSQEWKFL